MNHRLPSFKGEGGFQISDVINEFLREWDSRGSIFYLLTITWYRAVAVNSL